MLCKKPYMYQSFFPVGCGQCMPCRINRGRLWSHRMMLETLKHPYNCFVTLTYSNEFGPVSNSLRPKDAQDWLKRLRKALDGRKIRYFLVGEYGEQGHRPHFHAALYNVGEEDSLVIEKTWGRGGIHVGSLTKDSAQYISGYVTKKMTHKEEDCTSECRHPPLAGRHPEFARMSNRPGIAGTTINELADILTSEKGVYVIEELGDVPHVLRHGGKSMPLGRYIRDKLRKKVGNIETIKEENQERFRMQMQELYQGYEEDKKAFKHSRRKFLLEKNKQKVLNLEVRTSIFASKKGKV